MTSPMFPVLAAIAAQSDYLLTNQFARQLGRAEQTLRKAHSLTGHYLGVRPIKLGNRLLWPVRDVETLLLGGN